MVTIFKKNNINIITGENQNEIEIRGLSTDDKPIQIDGVETMNGSIFIEIDTGKMFLYDADGNQWKEVE